MLDLEKLTIFRVVSRNNGSLSSREMKQVVEYMQNYPTYYMYGIHHNIPFVNDCGNNDMATVDLRIREIEDPNLLQFNP